MGLSLRGSPATHFRWVTYIAMPLVCSPNAPAALASDPAVEVWAKVPREKLLREIGPRFDVFVYPSNMDGLPYVLLEMMSLGVPAVVSNYGALPEIVGESGAVCEQ